MKSRGWEPDELDESFLRWIPGFLACGAALSLGHDWRTLLINEAIAAVIVAALLTPILVLRHRRRTDSSEGARDGALPPLRDAHGRLVQGRTNGRFRINRFNK